MLLTTGTGAIRDKEKKIVNNVIDWLNSIMDKDSYPSLVSEMMLVLHRVIVSSKSGFEEIPNATRIRSIALALFKTTSTRLVVGEFLSVFYFIVDCA